MSPKKLSRRSVLRLSGIALAGIAAASCQPKVVEKVVEKEITKVVKEVVKETVVVEGQPKEVTKVVEKEKVVTATPAPTKPYEAQVNILGKEYPSEAAPLDEQEFVIWSGTPYAVDRFVTMYNSGGGIPGACGLHLVRFDNDYNVLPGAAESWQMSEDGTKWTFNLHKGITWSDGNPLTADDYVFSFQYAATPSHAWDFAWYYNNIKNWVEATAGKVPVTEIGVKKIDDYTLQFETVDAAPYLPGQLIWSACMSKAAFEKYGELYNSSLETFCTCSPLKLTKWEKDVEFVYELNEKYTGPKEMAPYFTRFRSTIPAAIDTLTAYQTSDVTWMRVDATVGRVAEADPELRKQLHWGYGDFRTFFVGFNYQPPFDNPKVREAIALAIPKEVLIPAAIGNGGAVAYTFLADGFPGSFESTPEAKTLQPYDPERAKQLLAEAGYPDGKGMPALAIPGVTTLGDSGFILVQGIAAELQKTLGIKAESVRPEQKVFIDEARTKRAVLMYVDSYGMDYLDQSNMLNIFNTNKLICWNDETYDRMIQEASAYLGDKNMRDTMFWEAEKRLLKSFAIIPLYHQRIPYMVKPYVGGPAMQADKAGVDGPHWPDGDYAMGICMTDSYIKKTE